MNHKNRKRSWNIREHECTMEIKGNKYKAGQTDPSIISVTWSQTSELLRVELILSSPLRSHLSPHFHLHSSHGDILLSASVKPLLSVSHLIIMEAMRRCDRQRCDSYLSGQANCAGWRLDDLLSDLIITHLGLHTRLALWWAEEGRDNNLTATVQCFGK